MNVRDFLDRVGRGGGKGPTLRDGIEFKLYKSTHENKSLTEKDVTIIISVKTMEVMRWVTGDRVTLDIDPAKSEGCLRRVPHQGKDVTWKLCAHSGKKGNQDGTIVQASFRIRAYDRLLMALGMEDMDVGQSYIPATFITAPEGIIFPLRRQWRVNCVK